MELKQIKELMVAMRRHGTKRLTFKKDGVELELEREVPVTERETVEYVPSSLERQRLVEPTLPKSEPPPSPKKEEDTSSVYVTSPMVGTFYASPSPTDPHFVQVGDTLTSDTVVCVIEAMKVMNEIKAGVSGVVLEVLVENAHPVEFGTQLLKVKPTGS